MTVGVTEILIAECRQTGVRLGFLKLAEPLWVSAESGAEEPPTDTFRRSS